jgi:peptidylprolyl isomerase
MKAAILLLLLLVSCAQETVDSDAYAYGDLEQLPVQMPVDAATEFETMATVILETNKGNITIELDKNMPVTAGNFKKLVEEGFYDGVIFHRVIPNFMIQGGDPTGTGMGGPGYTIKDEFTKSNKNNRGTISMANAGPNTGGSQFFINIVDNNYLDKGHPVFGKVTSGMEVVDSIANAPRDRGDRPREEIKIIKARVV